MQTARTLGTLLAGTWNKERFASIADTPVPNIMVYRVAQLALTGWEFCGANDKPVIQMERDDAILTIDANGDVLVEDMSEHEYE